MLRKLIAGLLLILIVLPFTAPFAIVDMPTLFGEDSPAAGEQTLLMPGIGDGACALVAPAGRSRARSRTVLRLDPGLSAPRIATPARDADRLLLTGCGLVDRPSLTPLRI
jgi:hypothetical protein